MYDMDVDKVAERVYIASSKTPTELLHFHSSDLVVFNFYHFTPIEEYKLLKTTDFYDLYHIPVGDFLVCYAPILDDPSVDLSGHVPVITKLAKFFYDKQYTLVFQCHAGISRSSTFALAFYMKEKDLTYEDAFDEFSNKRPIIQPNSGFEKYLQSLS